MDKGPFGIGGGGQVRGHPGGDEFGQTEHLGGVGLNEVLAPQQALEGRGEGRPGHVIEQEDFLLFQFGVGTFGHLGKKDNGHPARRRPDARAQHQLQVHRAGHHHEADEDRPDNGLPVETLLEMVRGLEQIAIFLEFLVVVHRGLQDGRTR